VVLVDNTFRYTVKWNPERKKWVVQEERRFSPDLVLDMYRRKREAKKQARDLAREDSKEYVSFTKEAPGRRRVAERTDYS